MINGVKIYEIVFMFAVFSVLGYLVEQCICTAMGRIAKRGILAGPYGAIYGFGGAAAALALGPVPERDEYPYITSYIEGLDEGPGRMLLLAALVLACFVLYYVLWLILKAMSGKGFYSLSPIYPVIATLCAMVAVFQIRPVVMLLASGLPGIIVIVVTVLIAGGIFSNAVDAIPALIEYNDRSRKESPWVSVDGARDPEEEKAGPFDHLKTEGSTEPSDEDHIISRWERAYPCLKKKQRKNHS